MGPETVTAIAPTRVDLAGGTLDIWPLNLFFDEPVTINMAIDIRTRAKVSRRRDGKITLISEDQKRKVVFKNLAALRHDHPLAMLSRLAEHFLDGTGGVEISTKSEAPSGAGLAGSSALNIALCGALARFTARKITREGLISIAKDIEAALLGVPTGLQDYGAAVYGSANVFHFPPGGMRREKLGDAGAKVAERALLFYSGASRNSGINNWEMFKRVVDKNRSATARFRVIAERAREAADALREGDIKSFEKAVGEEWKARKGLFPEISTPVIERAVTAGRKAGARAARICGAGGGGCFTLFAPSERHDAVTAAVEDEGARRIHFNLSKTGLRVYI